MGFWEKMMGRKPVEAEPLSVAPESEVEVEPTSPELAAEAQEMKEHLSALEKIVDDPDLEAKVAKLPPEARMSLGQRIKELGALCSGVVMGISGAVSGSMAIEGVARGNEALASVGAIGALAYLGISVASLRYVWKRSRERLLPQDEA